MHTRESSQTAVQNRTESTAKTCSGKPWGHPPWSCGCVGETSAPSVAWQNCQLSAVTAFKLWWVVLNVVVNNSSPRWPRDGVWCSVWWLWLREVSYGMKATNLHTLSNESVKKCVLFLLWWIKQVKIVSLKWFSTVFSLLQASYVYVTTFSKNIVYLSAYSDWLVFFFFSFYSIAIKSNFQISQLRHPWNTTFSQLIIISVYTQL